MLLVLLLDNLKAAKFKRFIDNYCGLLINEIQSEGYTKARSKGRVSQSIS